MEASSPQRLTAADAAGDTSGLVIASGLDLQSVEEMEVMAKRNGGAGGGEVVRELVSAIARPVIVRHWLVARVRYAASACTTEDAAALPSVCAAKLATASSNGAPRCLIAAPPLSRAPAVLTADSHSLVRC